jgi:hypothetical protein
LVIVKGSVNLARVWDEATGSPAAFVSLSLARDELERRFVSATFELFSSNVFPQNLVDALAIAAFLRRDWLTCGAFVSSVMVFLSIHTISCLASRPARGRRLPFVIAAWTHLVLTMTPLFEPINESLLTSQVAMRVALQFVEMPADESFYYQELVRGPLRIDTNTHGLHAIHSEAMWFFRSAQFAWALTLATLAQLWFGRRDSTFDAVARDGA